MSNQDGRIVVGTDGSLRSKVALLWALREAARRRSTIEVVHAWDYPGVSVAVYGTEPVPVLAPEDIERAAHAALEKTLADIGVPDGVTVTATVERGRPAEVLAAHAVGADLLVVGSRGHGGFTGMLLGSVSAVLARKAPCPVAVVNDEAPDGGAVVVGVDGSPPSVAALRWALAEARLRGVTLRVVHAWQPPVALLMGELAALEPEGLELAAWDVVEAVLAAVADDAAGVDVETHVLRAHAVDAILHAAGDGALVVVGSRGLGGVGDLLLGSVSNGVVHHAPCPTVIVRATG